jgi:hypothetical protein
MCQKLWVAGSKPFGFRKTAATGIVGTDENLGAQSTFPNYTIHHVSDFVIGHPTCFAGCQRQHTNKNRLTNFSKIFFLEMLRELRKRGDGHEDQVIRAGA